MKLILQTICVLTLTALLISCGSPEQDAESIKKSAMAHIGSGKYKEALEELRTAMKTIPSDRDVLYFMGVCHKELGSADSASIYFRKTLLLHGPDKELLQNLVDASFNAQNWDNALDGLRGLVEIGVPRKDLFRRFYIVYAQAGYYGPASDIADSLIKYNPTDSTMYLQSAELKNLIEKYDAAEMVLQEALRRFGPSAEVYNNLGVVSMKQKKLDRAEMYFRKALDINPANDGAWMNLANALAGRASITKKQEAIAAYKKVSPEMFQKMRLDTAIDNLQNAISAGK